MRKDENEAQWALTLANMRFKDFKDIRHQKSQKILNMNIICKLIYLTYPHALLKNTGDEMLKSSQIDENSDDSKLSIWPGNSFWESGRWHFTYLFS